MASSVPSLFPQHSTRALGNLAVEIAFVQLNGPFQFRGRLRKHPEPLVGNAKQVMRLHACWIIAHIRFEERFSFLKTHQGNEDFGERKFCRLSYRINLRSTAVSIGGLGIFLLTVKNAPRFRSAKPDFGFCCTIS